MILIFILPGTEVIYTRTEYVISSDPPFIKYDSQQYPLNIYLINNLEDIVVFLAWKEFL